MQARCTFLRASLILVFTSCPVLDNLFLPGGASHIRFARRPGSVSGGAGHASGESFSKGNEGDT